MSILSWEKNESAAISGHAFGAGAIFSCACDFRSMKAVTCGGDNAA